jgi:hypothetical protein
MPEHDKFLPHKEDANIIGEFIEWLQSKNINLMIWDKIEEEIPCWRCTGADKECKRCGGEGFTQSSTEDWTHWNHDIRTIIAEYFGIDKKAFDAETEALYQVVSEAANHART